MQYESWDIRGEPPNSGNKVLAVITNSGRTKICQWRASQICAASVAWHVEQKNNLVAIEMTSEGALKASLPASAQRDCEGFGAIKTLGARG